MKERKQENAKENYQWLDPSDERKHMTDKEILKKHMDLDKSCLTEKKDEVMDMMYKFKEVFSLRDEICMSPNVEV